MEGPRSGGDWPYSQRMHELVVRVLLPPHVSQLWELPCGGTDWASGLWAGLSLHP